MSASSSITVSVSTPSNANRSHHMIRVQFPQPRQYKFVICFSPLHGNFNDAILVVENLELAQELGADHAVVYNTSIDPTVSTVLQHYVKTGFLEVKNWRDPPEPIHYKGQMGANNDCLLYNHNRTDFVVFMDFDEMIVPQIHKSWSEMMDHILKIPPSDSTDLKIDQNGLKRDANQSSKSKTLSAKVSKNGKKIGAVTFPSALFFNAKLTNLTVEEMKFATDFSVPFLVRPNRTSKVTFRRCKTILNPRAVDIAGIHKVFFFLEGHKTLMANGKIGLVHHYRWDSTGKGVQDLSLIRFGHVLVRRMKKTFKSLDTRTFVVKS